MKLRKIKRFYDSKPFYCFNAFYKPASSSEWALYSIKRRVQK